MYKNVQVNHYNSATSPTTIPRSSSPSFLPSHANQTATSLSAPVTSASSSSSPSTSAIPIARPSSSTKTSISRTRIGDGGISLPVSFDSPSQSMSLAQSSKLKSDVDQLDDLVKDLLIEVNRPIGTATTSTRNNSTSSTNNTANHNSNNNNNKFSNSSSSSYSYHRRSNNENNEPVNVKLPSSVRASSYAQASTFNNQKRNEFDANTVSGLIDGSSLSSNGVQREEQRLKSTREERIRIKRGGGASNGVTDIPVTTSSSTTTTTTTTNKPAQSGSSRDQLSIDEQLIDSLLESVQNTLRKRSQQQRTHQPSWTTDVPIHQQQSTTNRRTYSSSAAFPDSVHRMDAMRGRFPIKLVRTDSPTSTLSSRRPYSRQDNRDGYTTAVTSASTTAIPSHFRATSEPPPDGPLELRRMDLMRSPSRTYLDGPPQESYPYARSTLPTGGIRVRGHDYSGYETDTGLVTARAYGPRYYGGPPPPMHPSHYPPQPMHFVRERQHDGEMSNGGGGSHRSMLRPDGYDTDTGLISSGRLRMTRTLPPRMAAIPETLVVNNRMMSSSNLNTVPSNLRGSSFFNEPSSTSLRSRPDHLGGYETDSGMHIRQGNFGRRPVPVDVQYGDSGWVGKQPMPRPQSQQQQQHQHQQQGYIDQHSQRYRAPQYHSQDQLRSTSIPVFSHDPSANISRLPEQHLSMGNKIHPQRTTNTLPSSSVDGKQQTKGGKRDISIIPSLFPGSVGLSNPPSNNRHQPQPPLSPELKRKFSNDLVLNRPGRSQRPHLDSMPSPSITKPQIFSTTAEIIPHVNQERHDSSSSSMMRTPATPTFPVTSQSYHQHVQTRVGNGSSRNQDESSRRSSLSSTAETDNIRQGAYQAHNVSQFWYKEKLSREDAINLLKNKAAGTFLVRDSQGFPGSYGLAVKVETLPQGIQAKPGADPNAELVRHYLIERTPTGHVRLKGCPNEPDFANLSALVYQHSITPLALPTRLVLPANDFTEDYRSMVNVQDTGKKMSVKDLLEKGAACNVLYLNNVDVESLSGQMAVSKALRATFDNADRLQPTTVHFKVSSTGITLTDTRKKLFSRRHFPKEYVTYCGMDYEADRYWTYQYHDTDMLSKAKCFGFVSKKINGSNRNGQTENECHVFVEIDRTQPSTAIVNFVSKVMIGSVPV